MKLRTKKMLSLLLASAMVFTMNTAVFAEEVTVDAAEEFVEVDSVDSVEEIPGIETEVTSLSQDDLDALSENDVSGNSVSAQNLMLYVKYGDQVKEDLAAYEAQTIAAAKDATYSFTLRYDKAVGYDGRKLGFAGNNDKNKFNPVAFNLFYYKGTSSNAAISGNSVSKDEISANEIASGWVDISSYIKDVKFHQAKGATVDISGNGLVAAKDCAYITDIKLDTKALTDAKIDGLDKKAIKTLQKELSSSLKETATTIKKDKTSKISANGIPADKDAKDDNKINNVIAVYPAFVWDGNSTNDDAWSAWNKAGIKTFNIGTWNFKKDTGLGIDSKKVTSVDKKDKTKVKSIKGYFSWPEYKKDGSDAGYKQKKVTLKPDKLQSGKATKLNGLYTTEQKAKTVTAVKAKDDKMYTVNASGNVFGVISFDPDAVK
ncbi:MAG: hypothetical protein K6A90_06030 [Lachnospiraceae bacterium]|nr:hypothetical protein [Lachnospiraceae bacterium]